MGDFIGRLNFLLDRVNLRKTLTAEEIESFAAGLMDTLWKGIALRPGHSAKGTEGRSMASNGVERYSKRGAIFMDLNTTRVQSANPEIGVCLACHEKIFLAEDVCSACGARQSALIQAIRKRGVGGAPAAQPRHPIYVLYHGSSFGYFIVGIVLLIVIGIPTLVCLYRLYETAVRL